MSNVKEQTLAGVKWNAIGQFSSKGITFVLGLMIARMLMPEDYGVIGMLAIFISIAQAFVDSGFEYALIQKIDRTETDCSTAFYFNIAVGLVAYAILFLLAPDIAAFYNMPILSDIIRILSVSIIIQSAGIVPRALRSVAVDFKSQAYALISASVFSGLLGLYLAYRGYGVWALIWQQLVHALVSVVIIWILARWVPKCGYSWRSFKALFGFGSKVMTARLLQVTYLNASKLLIGKFYTPANLGCYDWGYKLASFPSLKLGDVLHTVTFPILSNLQNDNNRLVNVYQQYIAITSMVIFFVMTLLAVVAKPLILIILTEKWIGVVPFLQVLCLAFMFDSICRLNNNMLFVKGWSGLFLRLEVVKKVVVAPVFIVAVHYGVMAICLVAVVHTAVDISCSTYYLRKRLGVKMRQYRSAVKYLFLSVVACAPAYMICGFELSPFITLSLGIIMALALYWALLYRDENLRMVMGQFWLMVRK